MYRFLAAFLVLTTLPFALGSEATAKTELSLKRPTVLKSFTAPKTTPKKAEAGQASAQAENVKTIVREEAAVVVDEKSDFTAPEGALYTTSDECG
jgi:hypothetical protein